MRAAYGEGPPTWNLMIGALCERFHKLPEEIEGCDIVNLLQITHELDLLKMFVKFQSNPKAMSESEMEIIGEILRWDKDGV